MKKFIFSISMAVLTVASNQAQVLISQYVETETGSTPKAIEIWNASGADIDLSVSNIQIYQGTNGGALTAIAGTLLNTGTFLNNTVIVFGTTDVGTYLTNNGLSSVRFVNFAFTFNGDDAIGLYRGGALVDTFGTVGTDPGTSWVGNSVNTANQNIALLAGITTASTGWSDPSIRFETISTTPGASVLTTGLAGFGVAPVPEPSSSILIVLGAAGLIGIRAFGRKRE